jgi:hypothetical protein
MEAVAIQGQVAEKTVEPELPRGLRLRGGVYWINKKIDGVRYQKSTGCKIIEVFNEFLAEHGQNSMAGSGRRLQTDRPKLSKGLYWKGTVIWLSRMVDGKHYNISTGTDTVSLAKQFLDNFNVKAFKHEKLGVIHTALLSLELF